MRIRVIFIALCFYTLYAVQSAKAQSIYSADYSVRNETKAGVITTSQAWRVRRSDGIEYIEKRGYTDKNTFVSTVEHRDVWGVKIVSPGPTYQKMRYFFSTVSRTGK